MGFKKGANGIESKGKTQGTNLGDSGPSAPAQKGRSVKHGVSSMKMKEVGRNLARVANQGMRKSAGRGR
jgi:hypothetical protein